MLSAKILGAWSYQTAFAPVVSISGRNSPSITTFMFLKKKKTVGAEGRGPFWSLECDVNIIMQRSMERPESKKMPNKTDTQASRS